MQNANNWRKSLFEDVMVIAVLMSIGAIVATVKLAPIVLRWLQRSAK